ncbi:hypothetical protein Hanom_Chr14g01280461 [Helianthus anomalus]
MHANSKVSGSYAILLTKEMARDPKNLKINIIFLVNFRVGITLPTVEVRFERLTIEADCDIGDRSLPSLANSARNLFELALGCFGISLAGKNKTHHP